VTVLVTVLITETVFGVEIRHIGKGPIRRDGHADGGNSRPRIVATTVGGGSVESRKRSWSQISIRNWLHRRRAPLGVIGHPLGAESAPEITANPRGRAECQSPQRYSTVGGHVSPYTGLTAGTHQSAAKMRQCKTAKQPILNQCVVSISDPGVTRRLSIVVHPYLLRRRPSKHSHSPATPGNRPRLVNLIARAHLQSGEHRNQRRGDYLTQCRGEYLVRSTEGMDIPPKPLRFQIVPFARVFAAPRSHSKGITTNHPLRPVQSNCPTSVPWTPS